MAPKEAKAKSSTSKKAIKAKKDPNAPKRGLSAYMFFSQDAREKVKTENPSASFGELGRLLGGKWKEMSAADKKPYEDMAARDKARYETEAKTYESSGAKKAFTDASAASATAAAAPEEEEEE